MLVAKVNDKICDLTTPINENASIELISWQEEVGKNTFWHSTAHLMAEAITNKFPDAKFWVGPCY